VLQLREHAVIRLAATNLVIKRFVVCQVKLIKSWRGAAKNDLDRVL